MFKKISALVCACLLTVSTAYATTPKGGVHIVHATVPAQDFREFTYEFIPGTARIVVQGDKSTNLDCVLMDRKGKVLLQDNRPIDNCYFSFSVVQAGEITLKVTNLGDVYNEFTIETR